MLTEYISAAMRSAHYELMESGRFFGTIPDCQGVWGEDATLEGARGELQSTLEDWLLIKLRHGDPLPVVSGVDLNPQPGHAETN